MNANEIGQKLVGLCKEGKNHEAARTLYADDVVSVEAAAPPYGGDRIAKGLPAVLAKGKAWSDNHVVHAAETHGPYPHGDDRFAVRFVYFVTHKPSGASRKLDEVGVFHVANGKVVREEFFHPTGE